jgi:hypothetical protein
MNRIFEVQDKTGRKIHLSKERWSHIQRHPEMSNQIDQIIETLKSPQTIRTFEYDSNVKFYYRYYKNTGQYLFVSVKYLNGEGFIITSFFTDKIL